MNDHLRAEEFYREALALAPTNPLYRQLLNQATQAHIDRYFANLTTKLPLAPKWFDEQRGKGFVVNRDLPYVHPTSHAAPPLRF